MKKINKVFIDSSAWLALTILSDSNHNKASDVFTSFPHNTNFYVSIMIINEVLTKIRKILDQKEADKFYKQLKKSIKLKRVEIIEIDMKDIEKSVKLMSRNPTPNTFSFTDATNIILCHKNKISLLFSFDGDFKRFKSNKLSVLS